MAGRRWAPDDDAVVRDLALRRPAKEIAAALGRTVRACRDRANELGVRLAAPQARGLCAGNRRYATDNGWPADLPPRAVQVLNVLAVHGPQTAPELATRIGLPTGSLRSGRQRILLRARGSGGTYTAMLLRRGLILRHLRYGTHMTRAGRKGKKIGALYMLTAAAVAMVQERVGRGEECRQSA